ncbi:MAG: transporter [Syntrophus sp. GWC2_56_31]|nr:MAG: transporter [Syntrophus sp. GWC2_56_31]
MSLLDQIFMGFNVAFQPLNLLFCFIGVLMGTLVGVLPGLGPVASISLLLPVTFHMDPVSAIIMLSGIYYGAMYGGSTTSILVNIPGEAASVVTCIDGYKMARQGRAGPALGISAFGSFIAATFSTIVLMFMAPPLAKMALRFGPPEYFSLMVLGLTLLTYLSSGPMSKALLMAGVGLFLGTIGVDSLTGTTRFTFDIPVLMDGVGLVPVVMGIFGVGEVLQNLELAIKRDIHVTKISHLLPTHQDWIQSKGAITRGTLIGFFLGILPGGGAIIASFASYAIEKRCSKTPEKFGTGMIAGVAGPEAANNSAAVGAFIPLLTLGIPPNAVMAILMGALMIHGIQPGPMLISQHPNLFWGVVISMYVGNAMLLVLNLPLIGLWVRVLRVPYTILFPLILLFCLIGSYTMKNNVSDIFVMIIFGVIGYLMRKYRYDAPPLVLALVLGTMMEESLRRSLLISGGSPFIFFQRPISAVIILGAIFMLGSSLIPGLRKKREKIEKIISEGEDNEKVGKIKSIG